MDAQHNTDPLKCKLFYAESYSEPTFSSANAGVWRIDPNLTTNQLLLGPIGMANGIGAGVHGSEASRPVPPASAVVL